MLTALFAAAIARPGSESTIIRLDHCQDTWIARQDPTANHGRDTLLGVAPGEATLVRFPGLARAFANHKNLVSAKLELKSVGRGAIAGLQAIVLRNPWEEGGATGAPEPDEKGKRPPALWSTWQHPSPGKRWSQDFGAALDPVGAVSQAGEVVTISALESVVLNWAKSPWENHGLLLRSESRSGFLSEEAEGLTGPTLVLEFADAPTEGISLLGADETSMGWKIKTSKTPTKVTWRSVSGKSGELVPTAEEFEVQMDTTEPSWFSFFQGSNEVPDRSVVLDRTDLVVKTTDDLKDRAVAQGLIDAFNDSVGPKSRYRSHPNGTQAKFRLSIESSSTKLQDFSDLIASALKAWPVPAGKSVDVRPDFGSLKGLPATALPFDADLTSRIGLPEVVILEQLAARRPVELPLPSTYFMPLVESNGERINDAEVQVGSANPEKVKGSVVLSKSHAAWPTIASPKTEIKITRGGESQTESISIWDLWAAGIRNPNGSGGRSVRVNLPEKPIDHSVNLAADRIVTDLAGNRPAVLNALVDGSESSTLTHESSSQANVVTIDLGRDYRIGEVEITFANELNQGLPLTVNLAQTGASELSDRAWVTAGSLLVSGKKLRTFSKITTGRYVRIVLPAGSSSNIAEIRVFGPTAG